LHEQRRHAGAVNGYTLLEVLAVLAIIAVLATLVLGLTGASRRKAYEGRARSDLSRIADALQEYWLKHGTYPNTTQMATSAVTNWLPAGFSFRDPWKSDYHYRFGSANAYQLSCDGPDQAPGTPDDITTGR
jgi:general secretion pathway protein G